MFVRVLGFVLEGAGAVGILISIGMRIGFAIANHPHNLARIVQSISTLCMFAGLAIIVVTYSILTRRLYQKENE